MAHVIVRMLCSHWVSAVGICVLCPSWSFVFTFLCRCSHINERRKYSCSRARGWAMSSTSNHPQHSKTETVAAIARYCSYSTITAPATAPPPALLFRVMRWRVWHWDPIVCAFVFVWVGMCRVGVCTYIEPGLTCRALHYIYMLLLGIHLQKVIVEAQTFPLFVVC